MPCPPRTGAACFRRVWEPDGVWAPASGHPQRGGRVLCCARARRREPARWQPASWLRVRARRGQLPAIGRSESRIAWHGRSQPGRQRLVVPAFYSCEACTWHSGPRHLSWTNPPPAAPTPASALAARTEHLWETCRKRKRELALSFGARKRHCAPRRLAQGAAGRLAWPRWAADRPTSRWRPPPSPSSPASSTSGRRRRAKKLLLLQPRLRLGLRLRLRLQLRLRPRGSSLTKRRQRKSPSQPCILPNE